MNIRLLKTLFCPALIVIALNQTVSAQGLGVASPQSMGLSASILDSATSRLQRHIDDGDIPGVVAAVARDGKIVYFESLGLMDLEQGKAMMENALFRTYSMTRQITSVAVLKLWQEGKFQFDDPIEMYLPQFADQQVLIDSSSSDASQARERVGDITIAHLLTHTSGLGGRGSGLYRANNVRDRNITLDEMVDNAARVPLFQDPGTQFRYGIHATILGKLVEVWSGQAFEDYLQQELFEPLGMSSTMFWADPRNAPRLAKVYRPTDGRLRPYAIESVPFTTEPRLIEGGVGLLSSVMDYMQFGQMLLNRGSYNGNEVLQQEAVDLAFENAIPDEVFPIGTRGHWTGSGWTLGGFNIVMDPAAYNHPVSADTIWWDGSAGTRYWIDPQQNMVIVIMAQVSPSGGNGFRENFKRLVDAAISERR
ncbi:MAG TPA: serine hydrolase domain-containing protein [Gammaproteobacteria bacterium]|jgi:CubicO group peptidase (beta-lactamase class C family)|nr:serine hydrolase domain-containing protein [Gammaproteobacteria bacterium]HJO11582.1 serine hydrolase domain-containing protein [Gammaproteobacteria bacterium]